MSRDERMQRLLGAVPVAVFECGPDGRLRWTNDKWRELTGLRGGTWLAAVHPEDRERVAAQLAGGAQLASGGVACRLDPACGGAQVLARLAPLPGDGGAAAGYVGCLEELATDGARPPDPLVDLAPVGLFEVRRDGRLRRVNAALAAALGQAPRDLVGRDLAEILHPEDAAAALARLAGLGAGETAALAVRVRARDGSYRRLAWDVSCGPGGETLVGASRDAAGGERGVLEAVVDAVAVLEPVRDAGGRPADLRVVACNAAAAALLGADPERAVGRAAGELLGPSAWRRLVQDALRVAETRERIEDEVWTGDLPGIAPAWLERRIAPFGDLIAWSVRDVTARRRTEDALRESEGLFRSLSTHVPVGVFRFDAELRLTWVNERFGEIHGVPPDELIGKPMRFLVDLVLEEDRGAVEQWRHWVAGGAHGVHRFEVRVRRPDGRIAWVDIGVVAVHGEGDDVAGYLGTVLDVTSQKEAEQDLRDSELRFRTLSESAPVGILEMAPDGDVLFVNGQACALTGRPAVELTGRGWLEAVHPEDRRAVEASWRRSLATGCDLQLEHRVVRPDGRVVWVIVSATPLRDGHDAVRGWIATITDQTATKRAEERLRAAMDASLEAFALCDAVRDGEGRLIDLRVVDASASAAAVAGLSREEIVGRAASEVLAPEVFGKILPSCARVIETGTPLQEEYVGGGAGVGRWMERRVVRVGDGLAIAVRDVSARRAAEEGLRRAEANLARAQEIAHLGSWDWDVATGALWWSDEVYRIFGLEPREFEPTYEAFLERVHPDDRSRVEDAVRIALETRAPYAVEHRIVRPDGGERVVHEQGEATYDAGGRPVHMVGTVLDVTERTRAQEALRESEELFRTLSARAPVGIFRLDRDGTARWVNDLQCDLVGRPLAEIVGRPARAVMGDIHDDDRDELAAWENWLTAGGRGEHVFEARVVRPDGGVAWVLSTTVALHGGDGAVAGWLGTVLDITARKSAEERLRRSEELLRTAIDASLDAFMIFKAVRDAEGTIVDLHIADANAAAAATMGLTRREAVGRRMSEILPPSDAAEFLVAHARVIETGEPLEEEHSTAHLLGISADWVERRIVRSGDGTVLSYRDISERRRTEESLRRSEERLRRLAEHAPVGIFETDAEGRLLWASERWSEIVGIPGARAIGAGWLGALHPEDRERVSTAWGRAVRSGAPFDEECRLLAPDGRVVWVAARAIGLTDPAGRVTGLIGTVSDITDAKRAELEEDALRRAAIAIASDIPPRAVVALVAEEVAAVLEATACAVVQFDEREAEAVVVGAWSAGTHGLHAGSRLRLDSASAVARVHRTGETARSEEETAFDHVLPVDSRLAGAALSEVAAPVRMGRSLWGSIAVARIGERFPPDSEERLQRFSELVGLALANADARERLANLALTDYLTGLPNRRSFQERLAAEVGRAQRHGRPLALVVLDVDHFKEINDRFGHQVGDRVLVEFARRLSALARAGEEVARVGGEEFAWILPETDAAGAQVAAERARRRIAAEPFPGVGRVTVSGGLCDLDQASGSTELFRLADVALYWAKGQGRNRIVRYSPEVSEVLSAEERERRLRRAEALSGIRALAQAIDAKDTSTRRHSERVADLCQRIALAAGWAPDAAVRLREAALVHDVGKIGVRDQVLSKPGRLTEEELAEVRQHPLLGARMVEGVLEPDQVAWVRHHHERWDGAGYPAGLSGGDIPEGARMMALAEAWDAMTSVRAYAAALSVAEALAELRREAGRQFDPALAQVLCRLVEESAPPAAQELDAAS